ncbi:hypothetical protein X474_24305 [Dethiosulfatarculus sandiegensis]|uniref:Uncharacterized protein n=1 Tax=Dethiosulfatarculus sandiegensis TaxID=1429043 RepID=A0A0D2JQ09_9BACT|nr:hypothetical protein X474_24305 [Dethiosulfatarculus sandiegensis]
MIRLYRAVFLCHSQSGRFLEIKGNGIQHELQATLAVPRYLALAMRWSFPKAFSTRPLKRLMARLPFRSASDNGRFLKVLYMMPSNRPSSKSALLYSWP